MPQSDCFPASPSAPLSLWGWQAVLQPPDLLQVLAHIIQGLGAWHVFGRLLGTGQLLAPVSLGRFESRLPPPHGVRLPHQELLGTAESYRLRREVVPDAVGDR